MQPEMLRRAAAAVLMCALVGAALVAARSGSAAGAPLEALAAVWKPFPVQGLNVAYSSLPPSFEAGNFDAGRLPKIGFNTAPAGGWDGKLPAVPVRENEKNHPLSLAPFERLPAVQQANISAARAMAAAEVAANAYSGEEGGEEAGAGVEGGDQGDAAMRAQTTSASGRKAALKLLEKSAFALTAKAEAAMKAVEQAELRIEQQQEQPGLRQVQRTRTQLVKRGPDNFPKPRSISSGSRWGGDSREAGALLAARREVDRALQRIAEKHKRLRQPQMSPDDADQRGEEMTGGGEDEKRFSRAAREIYQHYETEYKDALDQNHEHEADSRVSSSMLPREAEFRSPSARQQLLQSSGTDQDRPSLRDVHRNDDFARAFYVPTSGPLERARSVKDVRLRNWPLVGQYGHTHAWPYVAMDGDLVIQNQDPVAGPKSCVDDPISVDCTGGFGGGLKSTGGPMDTRVGWRHDNELGYRPEIDGPVRVPSELQKAWNVYYGYPGADRTGRSVGASQAQADGLASKQQQLWDHQADAAAPPPFSAERAAADAGPEVRNLVRLQPFSPYARR